jgi:hypothetical protein
LVLTDDSLNVVAPYATQTIPLSGTGLIIPQTITFPPPAGPVIYGVPITLTATADSGLTVSYTVTGPATVIGSTLTPTGVGMVTVTANQAGDATHSAATPVVQTITVNKKDLTVTANNLTIPFGAPLPAYTATITGFVNGDTRGSATTGAPSLTTTPASPIDAGSYPITTALGTLAAANYSFTTFVNGHPENHHGRVVVDDPERSSVDGDVW